MLVPNEGMGFAQGGPRFTLPTPFGRPMDGYHS